MAELQKSTLRQVDIVITAKQGFRMKKKGDLSDLNVEMLAGARWAGLSISEISGLLRCSCTTICIFTERSKKRKYPRTGSAVWLMPKEKLANANLYFCFECMVRHSSPRNANPDLDPHTHLSKTHHCKTKLKICDQSTWQLIGQAADGGTLSTS